MGQNKRGSSLTLPVLTILFVSILLGTAVWLWSNTTVPYEPAVLIACVMLSLLHVEIGLHIHTLLRLRGWSLTVQLSALVLMSGMALNAVAFTLPTWAKRFLAVSIQDSVMVSAATWLIAGVPFLMAGVIAGLVYWPLTTSDHDDGALGNLWKDYALYWLLSWIIIGGSYVLAASLHGPAARGYLSSILTIDSLLAFSALLPITLMDQRYLRVLAVRKYDSPEARERYSRIALHVYIRDIWVGLFAAGFLLWQLWTIYANTR
jgi:hypothetical protein